jgi:hypothetical protein
MNNLLHSLGRTSIQISAITTFCSLLSNCSPYSKSQSLTREFTVAYGATRGRISQPAPSNMKNAVGAGPAALAATYLVGYLFDEVSDKIKEERAGDFLKKGIVLNTNSAFPNGGYLVVVRTVADPEGRFPGVATVEDFLAEDRPNTPGGRLKKQMVRSAGNKKDGYILDPSELSGTVKAALKHDVKPHDKIALLALCPMIPLNQESNDAKIYAIGLTGVYYPIIGGSRFSVESEDLVRRIAKSKEAMTLEIYGPQGTGYTTGVAKVPLVWNPPPKESDAQWMDSKALFGNLIAQEQEQELQELLSVKMNSRLSKRQAFVEPRKDIRSLLRADVSVRESSDATGWLLKQVDKAEKEMKGYIP